MKETEDIGLDFIIDKLTNSIENVVQETVLEQKYLF